MSWYVVGTTVLTVGAGAYTSEKERKSNRRANMSAEERRQESVDKAGELLGPYIESSEAANRQLMIEMGLGDPLREDEPVSREEYATRISGIQNEIDSFSAEDPTPQIIRGGRTEGVRRVESNRNNIARMENLQASLEREKAGLEAFEAREAINYEPTNNYMNIPGYQGAIDAGVQAVDQGAANAGALYSGTRGEALKEVGQDVQQSYYSNYMNMLQNLANPASATNLANINVGVQGDISKQNIQATQLRNENRNALASDVVGGLTSAGSSFIGQSKTPPPQPSLGLNRNQTDYSSYV